MNRRRWIQRGIALAIVAGVSAVAFAALPGDLVAEPPVIVVSLQPNISGSNAGSLRNVGPNPVSVSGIIADPACAASGVSAAGFPMATFTVPAGQTSTVRGFCPGTPTYGIRRCLQHVMSGGMEVGTVTVLCSTASSSLILQGPTTVTVPDAVVNMQGTPTTITVVNPMTNPGFNVVGIQVGDQEGNFTIGSPCFQDGLGCNATIAGPPGASIGINVRCTPKSLGPHSAPLYVVLDTGARLTTPVMMSCNGLDDAGMSPAISTDVTSVMASHGVNSGSVMRTVRISSTGPVPVDISSIQLTGPDWSATVTSPCESLSCSLGTTEFVDANLLFTQTVGGPRKGHLVINSNDPLRPVIDIPLYGTGQTAVLVPEMLGNPPALDIGSAPVGVEITRTFTLRNDGDIALDPVSLSTSGVFGIDTATTTIAAASTRQLTASCTPTAVQTFTGELLVVAPNASSGSPLSIAVSCTGTDGSFYADPASLPLGEIRIGMPTVSRTITLLSVGPVLDVSGSPTLATTVPGMSVGDVTPGSFSMLQPATFELEVIPMAEGDLANTITVSTTTSGSIDIPVTGQVVRPDVDVPAAIMAGSFCVNQSTQPTPSKLEANCTASIDLPSRPVMAGGASSPFQVVYTSPIMYPYRLPAGATATVDITPLRQMMEGTQTDQLVWATDSPGETAPTTTVTASFIDDGGAVAPQSIDFGGWPLRATADARLIRIQNCGTDAMTLDEVTIAPGDEFREESPGSLPDVLQPNQIATLTVGFTPRRVGSRMGTVTIASSKGPLNVSLFGTGLGDAGNNGDAMSFYACDCATSDPRGAWPAALVLLVLRRRRRR